MHSFRERMLYIVMVCLIFVGGISIGYIACLFQSSQTTGILRDNAVIAWVGVGVNLSVVFVALFMNVLREHLNKARFQVSCGEEPPWVVREVVGEAGSSKERLYLRLRVKNSGLSATDGCEVRLERIEALRHSEKGTTCRPLIHDPRSLKWIGRNCHPIQLSSGAFDFVDLGAQNEDYRENFRLEFDERGHLDLNLVRDDAEAYILEGHVYGNGAIPKEFSFRMTWDVDNESSDVIISEVERNGCN